MFLQVLTMKGIWVDEADAGEDTELGKLSEDDRPGWVMETISKRIQQCMDSFQQTQMRLDKLRQQGWGDAADYIQERDLMYRAAELKVPAGSMPQTDKDAAPPAETTFGELQETLDIVPGKLQIPQGTSRAGSHHLRLGTGKLQSHKPIASLPHNAGA